MICPILTKCGKSFRDFLLTRISRYTKIRNNDTSWLNSQYSRPVEFYHFRLSVIQAIRHIPGIQLINLFITLINIEFFEPYAGYCFLSRTNDKSSISILAQTPHPPQTCWCNTWMLPEKNWWRDWMLVLVPVLLILAKMCAKCYSYSFCKNVQTCKTFVWSVIPVGEMV